MMEKFNTHPKINGVTRLSGSAHPFEALYLFVREKENRILTDEQVSSLPDLDKQHPHSGEWLKRAQSAERFMSHLKSKGNHLKVLDIGCGNGWFSNLMAKAGNTVWAQDLNLYELEQGRRVFDHEQLHFFYSHDVRSLLDKETFDIITFNASFQYFEDGSSLIEDLRGHLNPQGEIHIIDSPFYQNEKDRKRAALRSMEYYKRVNCPELAKFYKHYVFSDLSNYEVLYRPKFSRLARLFGKTQSPFCWIVLR